ncbi:hypothetical protein [Vibrio comitans]
MSEKQQHNAHMTAEKMKHKYGTEVEHKHNKDHMQYGDKEKSHPHNKHGGSNEGHKHLVNHHSDGQHERHHNDKKHDHKQHTRNHHKTSTANK